MKQQFNCPSCGAEISFSSPISVYAVCSFCGSTVVRHDVNLDLLGKVATVDDSWTPIQLGVMGTYEGGQFSVVGRIKKEWSAGCWNEWFLIFSDGTYGWLSEAQGFYFISKPFKGGVAFAAREARSLSVGSPVEIANVTFSVVDKKEAKVVFMAGELPFAVAIGFASLSLDLASQSERFASIELPSTSKFGSMIPVEANPEEGKASRGTVEEMHIYVGRIVEFCDVSFTGLRSIDGWKLPTRLS